MVREVSEVSEIKEWLCRLSEGERDAGMVACSDILYTNRK